jgi:hypothetical protein
LHSLRLPVDILPVSDRHYEDEQPAIVYLVDHAVDADPDAQSRSAGQFLATRWAWIVSQQTNSIDNPLLLGPINLSQLLLRNPQDLDRVSHTPECYRISCTACSKGSRLPPSVSAAS